MKKKYKRLLKYRQSIQNSMILFFMSLLPFFIFLRAKYYDTKEIKESIINADFYAQEFISENSPIKHFEDLKLDIDLEEKIESYASDFIKLKFYNDKQDDLAIAVNTILLSSELNYGKKMFSDSKIVKEITSKNIFNVRLLTWGGFLCDPELVINYITNGYYLDTENESFDEEIYNNNFILRDYNRCINEYGDKGAELYDNYYSEIDFYYNAVGFSGSEIKEAKNGKTGVKIRKDINNNNNQIIYIAIPCTLLRFDVPEVENYKIENFTLLFSRKFYPTATKETFWGLSLVFLCIFIVGLIYSLIVHFRIYVPIIQLSKETSESLDRNGRIIKTDFKASKHNDELGDISRAFSSVIKRLDTREKELETYASDMSHEFKNPLSVIRIATDNLTAEDNNEEEKNLALKTILDEVQHLEFLLSEIRDTSKIENSLGKQEKELVPIDLLISNIIDRFKHIYPQHDFILRKGCPNFNYETSQLQLERVIENLIDNAASFANIVRISTYTENNKNGKSLNIIVSDNGPGVPTGEEEKIFTRFYSHRKDEQKKDHSGLGLYTVKAIVESFGGSIKVEKSKGLGGAKFIIQLPI